MRIWRDAGFIDLRVAINISPRQLHEAGFADRFMMVLGANGLTSAALELEITESELMHHPEPAIAMLHDLRTRGVSIAIDDFGTGHSSLARLHKLPVDRLKVDRSFISDLERDGDARAISACIVGLARSLNLEVIAEGVETPHQLRHLLDQGCHAIQGFLFARPMLPDALSLWQANRGCPASHGTA